MASRTPRWLRIARELRAEWLEVESQGSPSEAAMQLAAVMTLDSLIARVKSRPATTEGR